VIICLAMNKFPNVANVASVKCRMNMQLYIRLEFCGVISKFNTLITSCLKDRYQKVAVDKRETQNSISSGWEIVTRGVP
jgi:hypothetical protein